MLEGWRSGSADGRVGLVGIAVDEPAVGGVDAVVVFWRRVKPPHDVKSRLR